MQKSHVWNFISKICLQMLRFHSYMYFICNIFYLFPWILNIFKNVSFNGAFFGTIPVNFFFTKFVIQVPKFSTSYIHTVLHNNGVINDTVLLKKEIPFPPTAHNTKVNLYYSGTWYLCSFLGISICW